MKSKSTAAILAFFLGGIGVHRFYLGQGGYGVLYLLFCWTFIPAGIALIDFIVFLTMDDATFNSKYNGQSAISVRVNSNTAEELEKLHGLMLKGIITEEEFKIKKAKLM